MTWTFKGRAKRLDDIDLPRIGARIGVGEDEIHAFMDVEAAGSGFDSQGRPKMLFEPHRFYALLGPGKARDLAVSKGLAYERWGTRPYPSDSYPRLLAAMEIDETKALKAASWGLTQILGENHGSVGYGTVQVMVTALMDDEEKHLEAMVQFLIANHIDDDLKAHRWDVVARVYNGPGYAKNAYHTKMAAAYAKWQKIKDTPWTPETARPEPSPPPPSILPAPTSANPVPPAPTVPLPEEVKGGAARVIIGLIAAAGAALAAWIFGVHP